MSPQKDQEYFCLGLAESLIIALTQIQELLIPSNLSHNTSLTLSLMGEQNKAFNILENLLNRLLAYRKKEYIPPTWIAIVYHQLGNDDLAFEWLNIAYAERDYQMISLKVDPSLDSIQSDPRYKTTLKKMNFE